MELRISLTGPLTVTSASGAVFGGAAMGGRRPRHVLAALALAGGAPVSKDRLVDLLWEDAPPPRVVATLETYVSMLRRRICPGAGRAGAIRTVPGGYLLDTEQCSTDLEEMQRMADGARGRSARMGSDLLTRALTVGSRRLLDGEDGAWVEQEREQHRRQVQQMRVRSAHLALEAGLLARALEQGAAAVEEDPLDEGAWHALLTATLADGRPSDALRDYEQCRRALAIELGCSPGPALRAVQERALASAAESDSELSDLLSAVMRLHAAGRGPVPGPRPALEDDRLLVARLLTHAVAAQGPVVASAAVDVRADRRVGREDRLGLVG